MFYGEKNSHDDASARFVPDVFKSSVHLDWFKKRHLTWKQDGFAYNETTSSELFTLRGMASSFNMMKAGVLLNLDK